MQFTLNINDKDNLLKIFKQAPAIAAREFDASLETIAIKIVQDAKDAAPVNRGPEGTGKRGAGGNLRQSINYRKITTGSYVVFVNSLYGEWVDQGTLPHVILPKRGNFLRFQKDGRWVYARRVNHPGAKATHFFSNAVTEGELFANTEMAGAMKRVIDKL